MNWMFWRRATNNRQTGPDAGKNAKYSRPRNLPEQIGQHLVVRQKMDPDWVWNLKCVLRPHQENKHAFDFYVFSLAETQNAGITVKAYTTLETHPERILFYGWFDKYTNRIELHKGAPEKAA